MIPLMDMVAQYSSLADEIEAEVLHVLRGGRYVLGPAVERFEEEFAAFCGARHAVAVNTGTSALHLALLAAGVGPGDEVVTTPMTFVATAAAIHYVGAKPVFVDIDPRAWTIDPSLIERAVTPRTRAILPVHLHGRLAEIESIAEIAERRGLTLIEDAAQAHGAARGGRSAGTFGDVGCFSFYPGKNLGACGEGGALITDRDDVAEAVRRLRDWGQNGRYNHVDRGFNYRMDAIQGAILSVKLKRLRDWTERRRQIAARYDAGLADVDVDLPATARHGEHVYHVYAVRVAARDRTRAALAERRVETGVHYPKPVHLQPAYRDTAASAESCPHAEAMAAETLSLPIYPELADHQIDAICAALADVCGTRRSAA